MADVLLLGLGLTALSALDSLEAEFNVLGLVRDPDVRDRSADPVVDRARKYGIPVFSDVLPASVEALVAKLNPHCVVVSSYHRILNHDLITQRPFVNVHYSPLPRYRGRANVNWALINDEPCAAITIHLMTPEVDAGNILFQESILIQDSDTVADVYRALDELQREHLATTVRRLLNGYKGTPQQSQEATYGCSRVPADGEIDWTASTRNIYCLARALVSPFPGAYTHFEGKRLVVWKAEPVDKPPCYSGRIPGRVVGISKSEGYVDVLTGDGVLRMFEVQVDGGSRTAASNVIKSLRGTLGLRTIDLFERIQALERQIAKLMEARNVEA